MKKLEATIKRDIEDILQLVVAMFVIAVFTTLSILIVRAVPSMEEVVTESIFYSEANDKRVEKLEEVKHTELEVIFEEATQETKSLTNEERICLLVDDICEEMNFDKPELIKSMIYCESSFNKNSISHTGAQGLMQITPRHFRDLMEIHNVTDLCEDEEGNIRIGVSHIKRLIEKYEGNIHKALVAYNCGETYVYKNKITSSSYSKKVIRIAGEYIV